MSSSEDVDPNILARTSPYKNPFAPIYPSMPLSQFLGRSRPAIDGLLGAGRPSKLDAEGWDCQGSMDLRYNKRDVAVALRLRQQPHRYGQESWESWRRRFPGPSGHCTAEEIAAFAGFSSHQPASPQSGGRWRWPPGVLQSGLVPKGWLLEGSFNAGRHQLHLWRVE